MTVLRSRTRLALVTLVITLTICWLSACDSAPDPFDPPACPQLPAGVIRETVADLDSASPSPSNRGRASGEEGSLPATKTNEIAYSCYWPSIPGGERPYAFRVDVAPISVTSVEAYRRDMHQRADAVTLQSSSSGFGAVFYYDRSDSITARWVCGPRPGVADTQMMDLDLYQPKRPQDPKGDAKKLAEAIIPLLGCPATTASSATRTDSSAPSSVFTPTASQP